MNKILNESNSLLNLKAVLRFTKDLEINIINRNHKIVAYL